MNYRRFFERNALRCLIYLFLILQTFHLNAKDIIVNGYYISKKGDTIKTKFLIPLLDVSQYDSANSTLNDDIYSDYVKKKIPSQRKIQWGVIRIDERGKKYTLIPSNSKYFEFIYEKDTFKYVSFPNNDLSEKTNFFPSTPDSLFIRLIIKGQLSLYEYFEYTEVEIPFVQMQNYHNKRLRYCLKKEEDGNIHLFNSLFFRGNMIKYLSDCPEIKLKLENREYRESDIFKIVNEYNNCKK